MLEFRCVLVDLEAESISVRPHVRLSACPTRFERDIRANTERNNHSSRSNNNTKIQATTTTAVANSINDNPTTPFARYFPGKERGDDDEHGYGGQRR